MLDDRQTVLIVDDESMNFNILSKALKDKYRILVAKNGEQALKILEKNNVDIILLDIVMPDMDGYEVLRHLKSNDAGRHIPIIFTTAKTEDQDEAKGLQLGAVDYIKKPFFLPIVEARVRTHLDLKLKNDILTQLVSLDGLTNIFNRRKFDETLNEEWKRAQRVHTPLSLLIIDVDHFKLYNDNYGHATGDECLRRVSAAFKACLRRPGDFLARYGGEEFIILLPATDYQGCVSMAATVNQKVEGMHLTHEFSPVNSWVTVSIGGATAIAGQKCATPQQLLETADRMLFDAKESGRNTYTIYPFE